MGIEHSSRTWLTPDLVSAQDRPGCLGFLPSARSRGVVKREDSDLPAFSRRSRLVCATSARRARLRRSERAQHPATPALRRHPKGCVEIDRPAGLSCGIQTGTAERLQPVPCQHSPFGKPTWDSNRDQRAAGRCAGPAQRDRLGHARSSVWFRSPLVSLEHSCIARGRHANYRAAPSTTSIHSQGLTQRATATSAPGARAVLSGTPCGRARARAPRLGCPYSFRTSSPPCWWPK